MTRWCVIGLHLSYPRACGDLCFYGLVPDIVFLTSALLIDDNIDLYYGAADTTIAKAFTACTVLGCSQHEWVFTHLDVNPILAPRGDGFESVAVFNAAAIDVGGSVHILYRAMGKDATSTIGYARSVNGITIDERLDKPCYEPRADFEMKKRPGNPWLQIHAQSSSTTACI